MDENSYHIVPLDGKKILVIIKSPIRPELFLSELSVELKKYGDLSDVFFDFLVKNGTKDRFFKTNYNCLKNSFGSFVDTKVDTMVLCKANSYFLSNIQLINSSLLSSAQKYMFKKKLVSF